MAHVEEMETHQYHVSGHMYVLCLVVLHLYTHQSFILPFTQALLFIVAAATFLECGVNK